MAEFAPVCPPELLWLIKNAAPALMGNFHLVLAHDIAERPYMYNGLFEPGMTVIMDNSVIELGVPVSREVMAEACKVVTPTYVVLPDKIRDAAWSLQSAIVAASEWRGIIPQHTQFMCVPQGNDMGELMENAKQLHGNIGYNIGMWGVGRFQTALLGSRKGFTNYLLDKHRLRGYAGFIHLLGFSDNMQDDLACCAITGVRGIDSAVPLRMGQRDQLLSLEQPDHAPRADWWNEEHTELHAHTIANLALIRAWLHPLRGEIGEMAAGGTAWNHNKTGATEGGLPVSRVGGNI